MSAKEKTTLWVKRLSVGIGAFFATSCIFAVVILFTPAGTSLSRWIANSYVEGLDIEDAEGALLLDPTFHHLTYKGLGLKFSAGRLTLKLSPSTLFHQVLTLDMFALENASISYTESPESQNKKAQSLAPNSEKIVFPLRIDVKNMSLDNIRLQALDHKIRWKHFVSGLVFSDAGLVVKPTRWEGVDIRLARKQQVVKKEAGAVITKRLELPQIDLPFNIDVQNFSLSNFVLYQEEKEAPLAKVNQLLLKMQGKGADIDVKLLKVAMPEAKIDAIAKVSLKENYPLNVSLNAKIRQKPFENHKVNMTAQGTLADLTANFQLRGAQQAEIKANLNLLEPSIPFNVHLSSKKLGYPVQTLSDYRIENTELSLKGSLNNYHLRLRTRSNGTESPHADIALDGSGGLFSSGDWHIALTKLDIRGDYKKLPLDIRGGLSVQRHNKKIRLKTQGLNIAHGKNKIVLTGNINEDYRMNLRVDIPQLAKSFAPVSGSVYGNMAITGKLDEPKLKIGIEAKKLSYRKESSLEELSIRGDLFAYQKKSRTRPLIGGDLSISVMNARALTAGIVLDKVQMRVNGDESSHRLRFDAEGKPAGWHMDISGKFDESSGWRGSLISGKMKTSDVNWILEKPTDIQYLLKNTSVKIDSHCWKARQSQICLAEDFSFVPRQPGSASFVLKQLSLDLLHPFLPETMHLSGELNADIRADWSKKLDPSLSAKMEMNRGSLTQELSHPFYLEWDKITLNAKLKNKKLNSDILVDLTDNGNIKANLSIGNITERKKTMRGYLEITPLNLAFLSPVLGEHLELGGELSGRVGIAGLVKKPKLSGELTLKKYELHGDLAPLHIDDGHMSVAFRKDCGELRGKLKTPEGELHLAGDANWRDLGAWSTHFNIKGKDLKVTPKSGISIALSPDLTLSASPGDAEIIGKVVIPWARIKINEVPQGAVSVSDDQQFLDKSLQLVKTEETPPLNIRTDVTLEIDKNVKLRAYGLSAFLQGVLHITQVDKKPNIEGDINLFHGSYQALGQDLKITKGAIFFTGPPAQPYLNVRAIRNPDRIEDDVTAGIHVTGVATNLKVAIFSEPEMEEANALSYILRGRALGSDGGDGGMASALIGIGLAQSGAFIGGIGNALGVSDLVLDSEGEGEDTEVSLSGYITPDLQLKYGVGLFAPTGEFTMKYRLMKKLYVQAVTGMDNAVDLLYQFSFD